MPLRHTSPLKDLAQTCLLLTTAVACTPDDQPSDSGDAATTGSDTGETDECPLPGENSECLANEFVVEFSVETTHECQPAEGWSPVDLTDDGPFGGYCRYVWEGEGVANLEDLLQLPGQLSTTPNCFIESQATLAELQYADFHGSVGALDIDQVEGLFGPGTPVRIDLPDTAPSVTRDGAAVHAKLLASIIRELAGAGLDYEGPCVRCIHSSPALSMLDGGMDNYPGGGQYGLTHTVLRALQQIVRWRLSNTSTPHVVALALGWDTTDGQTAVVDQLQMLSASDSLLLAASGNLSDLANSDDLMGATGPAKIVTPTRDSPNCELDSPLLYPISPLLPDGRPLPTSRPNSSASHATGGWSGVGHSLFQPHGGDYGPYSGSSISTAVATATAALLMSYFPDKRTCEIMQIIWDSDPSGSPAAQIGPWSTQHQFTVCGAFKHACLTWGPEYGYGEDMCNQLTCVPPGEAQAPLCLANTLCTADPAQMGVQVQASLGECTGERATLVLPQPDETLCPHCGVGDGILYLSDGSVDVNVESVSITFWRVSGVRERIYFKGADLRAHTTTLGSAKIMVKDLSFANDPVTAAFMEVYHVSDKLDASGMTLLDDTNIRGNYLTIIDCDDPGTATACDDPVSEDNLVRFNRVDDGGIDRITVSDFAAINEIGAGDFTFEAWVKAEESEQPAHPTIFSNRATPNTGFLFLFHDIWNGSANKYPAVQLGGINFSPPNPPDLLDGQWHHFAARREGLELSYFADGSKFATMMLGQAYSIASPHPLWIGHDEVNSPNTQMNGIIADARIWGIARSDAEIEATMSVALVGTEPGLVGYWRLDEGQDQVATDVSGTCDGMFGSSPDVDGNDPVWVSEPGPF